MRVLGVVLLVVGAVRAQGARQLLASHFEQHVRQGAVACARANDVDAVRLLLRVLRSTEPRALAAAHYRDIVWDGLVRITDPYARKRVEEELRSNRRNARVRQWCAELLGIYNDHAFAPALVAALEDPSDDVRRWAARSLGTMRFEAALPALLRLVDTPNRFVRANAVEALARIAPSRHTRRLLASVVTDSDGGVRCALLGAVGAVFPGESVKASTQALADIDWRPRMQAVENLARIRTKPSVDALVRAAGDKRPLIAYRAIRTLQRFTGKQILEAGAWKRWWDENRATFEFPEKLSDLRPDGSVKTVAYGIPLVSDHVAFIIDKSARMADPLEATKTSKDKAAHRELKRVLGQLRGRLVFNVYMYRETIKAFREKPLRCELAEMHRALRFVAKQRTKGAKDIWQVLERVVTEPDLDTAFLLSSGEPDVGLYVHWNRVTRHLRDLNRFHKVTVHTVVYSERQWYRDQLEKIAQSTGGRFKWFR